MPLRITIAIATWNRCELLAQTLDSLSKLRIPAGVEWEALVCDNNSTDRTKAVVEAAAAHLPARYLFEPKQGKTHALGRLLAESTGQWMLFCDDDVLAEPDWLTAYVAAIKAHPDSAFLVGHIGPWLTKPVGKRGQFLLDNFPWVNALKYVTEDGPSDGSPDTLPHGANMAFRRDALASIGFDVNRGLFGDVRIGGEDTSLGVKLLALGHKGRLVKDARVRHYIHPHRLGLRWFWSWNASAGRARCQEKGPGQSGRFGYLWVWRLIAKRLGKAAIFWWIDRRRAYEFIADAAEWRGFAKASAKKMKASRETSP